MSYQRPPYRRRKKQKTPTRLIIVVFVLVGGGFVATKHDNTPSEASAGSDCAPGPMLLEGYKLPATSGKTGNEKSVDSTGTAADGERLAFAHLAKVSEAHRDYYITMRWNYAEWFWNGDSRIIDAKQRDWMKLTPRLIVVTNKTNNRKIVAAALEAGPAPWAGVDRESNNNPKQGWRNPQTGVTPPGYTGRVSGFPPKAIEALDASQGKYDGTGDILEYAWAANQKATPGVCKV